MSNLKNYVGIDEKTAFVIDRMILTKHISFLSIPKEFQTEKLLLSLMNPIFINPQLKITGIPLEFKTNYEFWKRAVNTHPKILRYVPRTFMTKNLFYIVCNQSAVDALTYFPKEFVTQSMTFYALKKCPVKLILDRAEPSYITQRFMTKAVNEIPVFNVRYLNIHEFVYSYKNKHKLSDIKKTLTSFGIPMLNKGEGTGRNGNVTKKDLISLMRTYIQPELFEYISSRTYHFYHWGYTKRKKGFIYDL